MAHSKKIFNQEQHELELLEQAMLKQAMQDSLLQSEKKNIEENEDNEDKELQKAINLSLNSFENENTNEDFWNMIEENGDNELQKAINLSLKLFENENTNEDFWNMIDNKCLNERGYKIRYSEPNGECQFISLSDAMKDAFEGSDNIPSKYRSGSSLRQEVVTHMEIFTDHYKEMFENGANFQVPECKEFWKDNKCPWDKYLSLMRKQGTYGDQLTLQAASDMLGVNIALFQITKKHGEYVCDLRTIESHGLRHKNRKLVIAFYGVHYNSATFKF